MEKTIKAYGKGGLHITFKQADGFKAGDKLEINTPNKAEEAMRKIAREVVREEMQQAKNY